MKSLFDFWESLPDEIKTALVTGISLLISSLVATTVFLFKFLQARNKRKSTEEELKQAQAEFELTKLKLETEKLALENELITGTYTVCPSCGSKLLLTDLVFKNDSRLTQVESNLKISNNKEVK